MRALAEQKVHRRVDAQTQAAKGDINKLLHELEVGQIELEVQNEELRAAQEQLNASHEELIKSQQEYADLFESAPTGYVILDSEAKITRLNRAAAYIFGRPHEQIKNHPMSMCVATEDLPKLAAHARSVFRDGARDECELRIVKPDGSIGYVCFICEPAKDDRGKVTECRASMVDVTERKKHEEELAKERANLQTIFDAVSVGMLLIDENGAVERVNNTIAEWAHKAPSAMLSGRIGEAMGCRHVIGNPDECGHLAECGACPVYRAFELALRTGRAVRNVEAQAILPIGDKPLGLWLEVSADRIILGGKRHVLLTMNDITARKLAEESLRQSEERFRTLSEMLPGIVWTSEPDGTVDYYNKSWYDYSGLPEDAPEPAWSQTIHPDDREATTQAWALSIRDGKPYEVEHRVRRADGQYYWHLTRGIPLQGNAGKIIKWFGMSVDIDDRKRMFEEIERVRGELENKNDELESIIRIASHDLRSPLTNIKGFSGELAKDLFAVRQMLKETPLPEKVSEKVEKVLGEYVPEAVGFIQGSADAINQMLKSLMEVAKAGTVPINIRDIDMEELLAKVTANAQFKLKKSGGQLEAEPLPPCRGDGDQLMQVLTNLIENAIKYRELSRPLHIQIRASTEADKVIYCVQDNGKGIAQGHLDKVFNLFTRLDPEAAKGEGIGLTIVKRMVERQGGKIWVESEVGKGSRFFVSLPI